MFSALGKGFLLLVMALAMSACVTEPQNRLANPERALADYIQLGRSYLAEGERDQARFNLLKALNVDSRSPEANNLMALLYESEGENELARDSYRRALSSDSSYTPARVNYARLLYAEEDYREASDQYQRAVDDVNYRLRANAFYGLALSQLRLGEDEEAGQSLRRAMQLNPSLAPALLEFAELAYDQRSFAISMQYLERFEQVATATPRSLDLGIRLAQVFSDSEKEATYRMALGSMFPDSLQARERRLEQ